VCTVSFFSTCCNTTCAVAASCATCRWMWFSRPPSGGRQLGSGAHLVTPRAVVTAVVARKALRRPQQRRLWRQPSPQPAAARKPACSCCRARLTVSGRCCCWFIGEVGGFPKEGAPRVGGASCSLTPGHGDPSVLRLGSQAGSLDFCSSNARRLFRRGLGLGYGSFFLAHARGLFRRAAWSLCSQLC
jgi:hypothetical protein